MGGLVGLIVLAVIAAVLGWGILRGIISFGTLVAFIDYAGKFFGPVQELSQRYTVMQSAMAAAERIIHLLDTVEPDAPISEAHGDDGDADAGDADGPRWIIDPIDGTISFSRGIPLFGTLIALTIAVVISA